MRRLVLVVACVAAWNASVRNVRAEAPCFRVSFDADLNADRAVGRSEPWAGKSVERVPGRFGNAARIGRGGELIYAGEQNLLAGRGTLACWCRITERPGPLDIQRLIFVQTKERGYWSYLLTMEWQESVFRAMIFDFYHGHGLHDPSGLPALGAGVWHHVALVWDQARGARFFLDGKPAATTWDEQAWWERPTPHAIHLSYPGAEYDELCVYDRPLSESEVARLAHENQWQVPDESSPLEQAGRRRLVESLGAVGLENLPSIDVSLKRSGPQAIFRQAKVKTILDDRIPAWKVMDGRMDLFWPEWRAPVLGDVDYSGSQLSVLLEPGQEAGHLVLRGLVGECQVFGERADGYVSREPIVTVPAGLHFLAAAPLPSGLTGLRIPRRDAMKLHEIGLFTVDHRPAETPPQVVATPLTGTIDLQDAPGLASDLRTRALPEERLALGKATGAPQESRRLAALRRVYLISEPVPQPLPLDAVELRLRFRAPWLESVWWVRIQDPVNPRRDLLCLPLRVRNPTPDREATFDVAFDFWDIMLDPAARVCVELLPEDELELVGGSGQPSELRLWGGDRARVLADFAHTQSQLAYSYWQLGSEAGGTSGADPDKPGFALLGTTTQNRELKLTMDWVRRYVPDQPLVKNLWQVTYARQAAAPVAPLRQQAGAPEWAVWGRELLDRFRQMAHHWADWQGPDGQVGGGWNDDPDFPGVFICLPLLGDVKTKAMFIRIFDGLERTGYLRNGISRSPIDALHATDFTSWRAHQMLFDYGQPRHVERALALTRELERWTERDANGDRRFPTGHYSEDGPGPQPRTEIDSGGLIHETEAGRDSPANRNFLREPLFCGWYSRNPAILKFVREVAEGDLARARAGARLSIYESSPFFSYFALFHDARFLEDPVDPFLRDRGNLPIWRRYAERLPNANRLDAQLLKAASARTAPEEQLVTAYLISKDKTFLVRALRDACARLEGGWQFRGGAAGGANDHFSVPGQAALSQMYLGGALTWLRPASILPPIAVSWQGLDADAAAIVLAASPQKLRLAAYNFDDRPRRVQMRVWELEPGTYRLHEGPDNDHDDRPDGTVTTRELALRRGSVVDIQLLPRQSQLIELEQQESRPRPELLPDPAVGDGDLFYDKATDRLKVVVHNIGAAAAESVVVRFEDPAGNVLADRTIPRLDAPVDLQPKTATVWLGQPLLHPVASITVRIDPEHRLQEITDENNTGRWSGTSR